MANSMRRRRPASALISPLSCLLLLFLSVSQTAGKTGYNQHSGGGGGHMGGGGGGYQGGLNGGLGVGGGYQGGDHNGLGGGFQGGHQNGGLGGGYQGQNQQLPTRLFMKPHQLPKTGPCGYLSKCTTCQNACPPPPGGCSKPTPVPSPGDNPTNCCPQWKCKDGPPGGY